ncbi:fatty acid-binding protein Fh15-like [Haliotis rufescens]|uniref:fatty acid-binding protein Fh15-like n=1 Tax=Haliotis rufescens TaxID=6454 RepID=UPI001EB0888B|nr:fatty acid-binding protein Fh15-like [Haliotis rufescens]
MEKFNGKWELVTGSYENLEAFSEKMGVLKEEVEMLKNAVMTTTIKMEGNKQRMTLECNGEPMKQELCFTEGEPLEYKGFEGSNMTSDYKWNGDRIAEKHKAEKDGTTREWTVERYIEGDMMVAKSTKDDVSMTYKMKKI